MQNQLQQQRNRFNISAKNAAALTTATTTTVAAATAKQHQCKTATALGAMLGNFFTDVIYDCSQ
jgi:hypothetical protein